MCEEELVSVIVPVYKTQKYLDRCIKSIVGQNYNNIEVILVDDGSPDDSPKMCDEWAKKDKRIKVIHKKNGGVSSARNAGIKAANGKYVCFVDSDDEVESCYCLDLVSALKQTKAQLAVGLITNIRIDGTTSCISGEDLLVNIKDSKTFKKVFVKYDLFSPCNKMFLKDKIKILFDEEKSYGEDLIFNLNYLKNIDSFYILNKPIYKYYQIENSLSFNDSDKILLKYGLIDKAVYENLLDFVKDNKICKYLSSYATFRNINYYVNDMLLQGFKSKEIKAKLNEIKKLPNLQFAINNFYPMDFKTKLCFKALKRQKYCLYLFALKMYNTIKKILK